MKIVDLVILLAVSYVALIAFIYKRKLKKQNKGCCSSGCDGCSGCTAGCKEKKDENNADSKIENKAKDKIENNADNKTEDKHEEYE